MTVRALWRFSLLTAAIFATASALPAQQGAPVPRVAATATVPTQQGGASRAILLLGGERPLIVGTAELAGLELYDLAGARVGSFAAGEAVGVDVRYGALSLAGQPSTLVGAADAQSGTLRFYRPSANSLSEVSATPLPLNIALEGMCFYASVQDGSLYAFALGDGGEVDQYLLFESAPGRVGARLVRRLHVPSTSEYCVADDRSGQLYVSEQAVGIWRFDAEPEAEIAPALIDAVRIGRISEEVAGLALFDGGPSARWLVAANAGDGRLFVYDRSKDDAYVGAVLVAGPAAAVEAPGGLSAANARLPGFPAGVLLVADDDAAGGSNYKAASFAALAKQLGIATGEPQPLETKVSPQFPIVRPLVETVPVAHGGDAADDPAIWANPNDPAGSLVIGTDKQGGLHIYDMRGKSIQFVPDGKMNNVDLRDGFRLGNESIVLVTASDRTNKAVAIYRLDTAAKQLVTIADGVQATGLSDPYGLCMYRSPRTGRYYVFVSDPDGLVRQWELVATRGGKVRLKLVRDLKF
jgi:3-phytase